MTVHLVIVNLSTCVLQFTRKDNVKQNSGYLSVRFTENKPTTFPGNVGTKIARRYGDSIRQKF